MHQSFLLWLGPRPNFPLAPHRQGSKQLHSLLPGASAGYSWCRVRLYGVSQEHVTVGKAYRSTRDRLCPSSLEVALGLEENVAKQLTLRCKINIWPSCVMQEFEAQVKK